jgi:hypothetical protein
MNKACEDGFVRTKNVNILAGEINKKEICSIFLNENLRLDAHMHILKHL